MRTIPTSFIQQSVPGSYYPRSTSKAGHSVSQEFSGPGYKYQNHPIYNESESADFPRANSDFKSNSLSLSEKDTFWTYQHHGYGNKGAKEDSIESRVNPSGHRGYSYLVEDPEPKIKGHKQTWHYDTSKRRQDNKDYWRPVSDYYPPKRPRQPPPSNTYYQPKPNGFPRPRPGSKRDRFHRPLRGYSRRPLNGGNRRLDSGHYGQFGSGHKSKHCCPKVFETEWFLALLAVIGVGTILVGRAIAANLRRKRSFFTFDWCLEGCDFSLSEYVLSGLEEFEDKVDKLAHGQGDENSWIGNLYHKFKGSFMGVEGNTIEQDGLEPPILDDKWGLGDVHTLFSENNSTLTVDNSTVASNVTEHSISKRALEDEDAEFLEETAEDDEFVKSLSGDAKCRTKFWRCVGKVAKGSIHYMQEPGGISGAFQKTMFRMAFHGGFGNVWNALMTIPEARRVKRCLNAQEECMSYEALRMELDAGSEFADEHTNKQRLIVNPELVENQDTSDGSEQYSPEVQASLDNNEI
ncbi:uncharacterized protein LOC131891730 isoform X2 [Tigriopus californicus]|uniref:uncharacterized protein LOC131891730 isoform X2 n=1 Tax=Tigriopus californicus TaxID=6832 RepID=UPI0027DA13D6|nr:uncharacterized protein LOC131891730 isoform X2 [Tigriopus californicus]